MRRREQAQGVKGSQKWIQALVNRRNKLFAQAVRGQIGLGKEEEIEWLSPLKDDAYAEYQGQAFISRLGVKLRRRPLESFWPKGGPVWDGLGRTASGQVMLVEAKSHIGELVSGGCRARTRSLAMIRRSLDETRGFLGSDFGADWAGQFYQYTNRLAHLYLLREINGVPAYLVFVYFINAEDVGGPSSREEWEGALGLVNRLLGVSRHRLSKYILDVFIDVKKIS